jgi:phosphate starvation-inducible protein PhoH
MARRQRKNTMHSHRDNVYALTEAISLNGRAAQEGPKRKTWNRHDLKNIRPLTPTQSDMFQDFFAGNNIVAYGSAGTGKSYVAMYLALSEYLRQDSGVDKIIIVRSAVPTRNQGYMPGDINEKSALFELPYKDIFADLLGRGSSYDDMKEAGIVEFHTTSYLRGLTWDNAIVIIDEFQSASWHELNSVMTRLGQDSRIIVCGDTKQDDLIYNKHDASGGGTLLQVVTNVPQFSTIKFSHHDIVRSEFVKSWVAACDDLGI